MYYPCSENKGADQLRSYCEADLRLCFRICRLLFFPRGGSFVDQTSSNEYVFINTIQFYCKQDMPMCFTTVMEKMSKASKYPYSFVGAPGYNWCFSFASVELDQVGSTVSVKSVFIKEAMEIYVCENITRKHKMRVCST